MRPMQILEDSKQLMLVDGHTSVVLARVGSGNT